MSIANASPLRASPGPAPVLGAPVVLAAPTPADKAPSPATSTSTSPRPVGFAELLRQNRVAPTPTSAAPSAPTSTPAAEPESQSDVGQEPSAIESKAASANAAKARAATRATGMAVESAKRDSETVGEEPKDDATDAAEAAATGPAAERIDGRSAAPIGLDARRPLPRSGSRDGDDAAGAGADDREAASRTGGEASRRGLGHGRGMAAIEAASERRSAVEASRDGALRGGGESSFHALLAETDRPSTLAAAAPAHDPGVDALTASLAAGAATRSAEPVPATVVTSPPTLPTPIDAPDFGAALGVHVSILARDGVQQAELHLNPAEMGPVSIRISLDGSAARVDFGADAAATREAIERGLPELASALRDAGFTLAGGGVSQHAGGRPTGDDAAAQAARRVGGASPLASATADAAPTGRIVRTVAAGGVDLYA